MSEHIDKLRPFRCHGVNLGYSSGDNVQGDCPFCGKEDHFYVNQKTGTWDCKYCQETGNVYTFLGKIAEQMHKETHAKDWEKLCRNRSCSKNVNDGKMVKPPIPVDAFRRARMGWTGDEWLIPVYSDKGTVRDIRRWKEGGKVQSTAGCNLQLWGLRELASAQPGSIVWLCEGEWDAIILRWLLDLAGRGQEIVTSAPGAGTFKREWAQWYKGMRVRVAFDNDESGDKGSMKAGDMLMGLAASVQYVSWPETLPTGWDIRDFVLSGRGTQITAERAVETLESLLRKTHRRAAHSSPEDDAAEEVIDDTPATFQDVLATFKKWAKVDQDFYDALAISLAICLCNDIPGDPLWLYLVAPPGSGKTLILLGLQTSERCMFYSTLTPASLVSGFNVSPDPSLLPELDGKTAIFKDGTELLAMHPDARREVYGVLRGAFDGHVRKRFGNGLLREYHLHFNMIIGVTPAIHGDNMATVGERFLKIQMKESDEEAKVRAAIENIGLEMQMQEELSEICRRFLLLKIDPSLLPGLGESALDRIVALAQLVEILRAQVDREAYGEREVKYRPSHGVGTRVAKQLSKLAQVLTYVFGTTTVGPEVMRIIERMALDSMTGYHLDIVRTILKTGNAGLDRRTICKMASMPETTATRKLQDLEQLGILEKKVAATPSANGALAKGVAPSLWRVADRIAALWRRARPPQKVLKAVAAPSSPNAGFLRLRRPGGPPSG